MQPSIPPRKNPLPLYALFAANAISLVGNVFTLIAIPWFVLQTTGSAAQTGVTGFFAVMPAVLAGFLGGTLIDRLGYKPPRIPVLHGRELCANSQLQPVITRVERETLLACEITAAVYEIVADSMT